MKKSISENLNSSTLSITMNRDRLSLLNNDSFLSKLKNMEEETENLKKLKISQNNLHDLLYKKQMNSQNSISKIQEELTNQNQKNSQLKEINFQLQKQYDDLVNEFNQLREKFEKINFDKKKLNDNIMQLRKESISEVDNKLAQKAKENAKIKKLKKEFCLLVNILKYRIVNSDSVPEDNEIKGYLLNIDRGIIQSFSSNRIEPLSKRYIDFWNELKSFLEPYDDNQKSNKENIPNNK